MDITAATRAPLKGIKSASEEIMEQAAEVRERLGRTASVALRDSKRALGRLQDSAEDTLDETKVNIRRHPFESVAIAAAVGSVVGLLIGYGLGSRRR